MTLQHTAFPWRMASAISSRRLAHLAGAPHLSSGCQSLGSRESDMDRKLIWSRGAGPRLHAAPLGTKTLRTATLLDETETARQPYVDFGHVRDEQQHDAHASQQRQ